TAIWDVVLFNLAGSNFYDKYSYTMAIPFICLALAYPERKKIFRQMDYSFGAGITILVSALIINFAAVKALPRIGVDIELSLRMLAFVAFCVGAFTVCFGMRTLRAGAFYFGLLLLSVPVPDFLLEKPIIAVQHGSANICSLVFTLLDIPVVRSGLQFALPNI